MSDYNSFEANNEYSYNTPAYPVAENNPPKGKSIASMVLGISSIVVSYFAWIPIGGLFCGIIGIVCSGIGMGMSKKCRDAAGALHGMAKAGKITSIIGLIIGILFTIIGIFVSLLLMADGYMFDLEDLFYGLY